MELDAKLLRTNYEILLERAPDLTRRFYAALFRRKPELEALFHRRPPAVQERMLGAALAAILDKLEDAPWLRRELARLGAAHAGYGVKREMYDDVGAALLETLADAAGGAWSAELEAQWRMAYATIRDLMLAGADHALATRWTLPSHV